ncbi:TenA family transcriptional regulator [Caballeronia sp. DA-9]|uniref:TenA family transcriptional regulator n=1 Tax=Caballeronia sp. DA-9 TaxID=3436237 RepID=UPI003F664E89
MNFLFFLANVCCPILLINSLCKAYGVYPFGCPAAHGALSISAGLIARDKSMSTEFIRSGDLKDIRSYPEWLQEVAADCEEKKLVALRHPFCKAMKDATLDMESTHRFLAGFFPVIEQFPQFMASNLMKSRFGTSRGEAMARSYLIQNIRVENMHAKHWLQWASASGLTMHEMLNLEVPSEMHALAHWCGHVSTTESLAVAVAATNYAVEGATGEFSCFVCSEDTYALTFPEPIRKSAMRWLNVHAHYDDEHPWMALDIVATLLGTNPSPESIIKVRNAIRKSYDYLRMTLDYAYSKPAKKDESREIKAVSGPVADMALV